MYQMTGYECYRCMNALNAHFKQVKYDFIKNPLARASIEAYIKNSFHSVYERNGFYDKQELVGYFLSYYENKRSIPTIMDLIEYRTKEKHLYKKWLIQVKALNKTLSDDLGFLLSEGDFKSVWLPVKGKLPIAFSAYSKREITTTTLILLDNLIGLFDRWSADIKPSVIWDKSRLPIDKYGYFINKNRDMVKHTLLEVYGKL